MFEIKFFSPTCTCILLLCALHLDKLFPTTELFTNIYELDVGQSWTESIIVSGEDDDAAATELATVRRRVEVSLDIF